MDKIGSGAGSGSNLGDDSSSSINAAAAPVSATPVSSNSIRKSSESREAHGYYNEYSDSDISMAAESDGEDHGVSPSVTERVSQPAVPKASGSADIQAVNMNKRKSSDRENSQMAAGISTSAPSKKAKLDVDQGVRLDSNTLNRDKSLLSPEIWHHIFTFCPPKTLGNLLRVNKLFHVYLDPSSSLQIVFPPSLGKGAAGFLKPNSIWQASRRLFWPHMPSPLRSMTELDSWRLACSTRCQGCNKQGARSQDSPPELWHPGPGKDGVSVIWPFAIRVCGPCLLNKSIKEVDLLLSSSTPSAIIPALPFVFATQELHALAPSTLEQGQLPSSLQLTKLFLATDVDALKEEFNFVKQMGSGTIEEWFKGLDGRGKDHKNESAKWQKWETAGGRTSVLTTLDPLSSQETRPLPTFTLSAAMPPSDLPQPLGQYSETAPRQPVEGNHSSHESRPLPQIRQERTIEEVAALKSARKAEIERRAALLDPPLPPNILRRMPSFHAAAQLITPLDDSAWDLLKPRLLAQRADAERREAEAMARTQVASLGKDNQGSLETTLAITKGARDMMDQEWEEAQVPVRASIAGFADEIIRDGWDNGKKVTKEAASKFAVDVLTQVRRRFYAEVAKAAAAARTAGQEPRADPPEGPFTQKLTLENMKWIFDTKIKPHTEQLIKELFFCNGCEGNYRAYGFEGVIQHYAAKHTSELSRGSVVVYWRAEWPEVPPFTPEARHPKMPSYPHGGPNTFPAAVGPVPHYGFNDHNHSFSPAGSAYGAASYSEQYAPQQHPYQQGYGVGYPLSSSFPNQPFQPQPVPAQYPPYQQPSAPNGTYPLHPVPGPPQGYGPQVLGPPPSQGIPPPAGAYNHNYAAFQGNGQVGYAPPPNPAYPDIYRVQLEDIARNSREIWTATANIKDLPGSARVFVTIYHVVKRFRSRFSETPRVEMFNDGLSDHKDMRPVRNINWLSCKACHFGLGNAASVEEDRKTFSLPQLVNHFQNKHVERMQQMGPGLPPLDWTVDMILLPDTSVLARLPAIIGSDSQRHYLFSEAFPDFFQPASNANSTVPYHPSQPPFVPPGHDYPAVSPPTSTDQHGNIYGQQAQANDSKMPPHTEQNSQSAAVSYGSFQQPGYGHAQNGHAPALSQEPGYATESKPKDATPVLSDDTRRHSSQGSGPRHGQKVKKRGKSRSTRGKHPSSPETTANLVNDEKVQVAEEEERAREEAIRAMWAADRAEVARGYSSAQPQVDRDRDARQPRGNSRPHASDESRMPVAMGRAKSRKPPQPSEASALPRDSHAQQEEPNLLAALEMHLEQGQPRTASEQRPQSPGRLYVDDGHRPPSRDSHRDPGRYPVQTSDRLQSKSPLLRGRPSLASAEGYRERSPVPRYVEPGGYGYAPLVGIRGELRYEQVPRPAHDQYDYVVRRPDVDPYSRAYREEVMYERPRPAPQEYYRTYTDELPPRSRASTHVEAYELVRVIDSQGEYYIRRPVRREPETRYVYADERPSVHLDRVRDPAPPEQYAPGYEPVYSRAPTQTYQSRDEYLPTRLARPAETAEAASYDEEYDPRFPAAPPPPPGGMVPRQVRYY